MSWFAVTFDWMKSIKAFFAGALAERPSGGWVSSHPMTSLHELSTPCLVLDRGRLQHNIDRMHDRAAELGVWLRPHLKTPKSIDVARLLMAR